MRKKIRLGLISIICWTMILLSVFGLISSCVAWNNGRPGLKSGYSSNAKTAINYEGDYIANNGYFYYGTHDWIAESALEILYSERSNDEFIQKLHDNSDPDDLKWWFLLGTEVPDYGSKTKISLDTKCGKNAVSSTDFFSNHQEIRVSGLKIMGPSKGQVDKAKNKAIEGFNEYDCQKAAYYLGAMVHIISDATFYPHLEGGSAGYKEFQTRMYYLTHDIYPLRTPQSFFTTTQASNFFDATDKEAPATALQNAVLDTYYGNEYQMSFTTDTYLRSFILLWNADEYWPPKDQYKTIESWTSANRLTMQGEEKDYFETLEHNLNAAIYYSAAAMNFVIDEYKKSCECRGTQEEDPQTERNPDRDANANSNELTQKKKLQLELTQFMGLFGIPAALVAVALVKNVKELEKVIVI